MGKTETPLTALQNQIEENKLNWSGPSREPLIRFPNLRPQRARVNDTIASVVNTEIFQKIGADFAEIMMILDREQSKYTVIRKIIEERVSSVIQTYLLSLEKSKKITSSWFDNKIFPANLYIIDKKNICVPVIYTYFSYMIGENAVEGNLAIGFDIKNRKIFIIFGNRGGGRILTLNSNKVVSLSLDTETQELAFQIEQIIAQEWRLGKLEYKIRSSDGSVKEWPTHNSTY